jgi:geranylgeranyl transferase type-1 subunit beta
MRFLYCACAISQMLNDWSGVDRVRASDYILSCLSYEGGFALTPGEEI